MASKESYVLDVASMAHGGEGVAHHLHGGERRAVFLPRTVVGDEVRAQIDWGSRPARGVVLEVVRPSSERVTVDCMHHASCGGCDWMQISQEEQERVARETLLELVPEAGPLRVHRPTPARFYRSRARLSLHTDKQRILRIGFFGEGSHRITDISTCLVLHPALERARHSLREIMRGTNGHGEARLALGRIEEHRRAVVHLSWSGELPAIFYERLDREVRDGDAIVGAQLLLDGARIPASFGDPIPWTLAGDEQPLELAPQGFAQASEIGNVALGKLVLEFAVQALGERRGSATLTELYAGAGNFTALLARLGKVLAVESDGPSVDAARRNLAARGLCAKFTACDADTYAPRERCDLLVLDPPRTGARAVSERISQFRAAHVLYVSCDATTLQRDLIALRAAHYVVTRAEALLLFPETSHFESVVLLSRQRQR